MNVQAAATFANLTDNINSSLETLRGLAEDHFVQDPDCVNWGHVGTLEHYSSLLKRITDSAFGEGEFAD